MTLVPSTTSLTHFKALSFDVFGTLIDWESGVYSSLVSLAPISTLPPSHPIYSRENLLTAFRQSERKIQQANPSLDYSILLADVFKDLAHSQNLSDPKIEELAATFAKSIEHWPPFPDTVDALHVLATHYKLIPLSNSSPSTLGPAIKNSLNAFPFTDVYMASEIGSYKPDPRNFEYLLRRVKEDHSIEKGELLHVAQSLFHDHEPASNIGLENVWIDRGGYMGVLKEDTNATFGWEVKTLGELAELVEKASEEEGKSK